MLAQEPAPEEQRLRALEQEMKAGEAEKARLQQRQDTVVRELGVLRTTMIGLAEEIQGQEQALTVLENRLGDLEKQEIKLKSTLGLRDEQMERVAMALQRMALRPTDAVTLSPLRPDDAVRTAILLRAAIPEVQASAKTLESELGQLYEVRTEMQAQQNKIALAAAGLIDKRRALEAKEQDKTKLQAELTLASAEATAKLQRLAEEASDLKDLVVKVIAQRAAEAKRQETQRQAALAKAPPQAGARIVLKPPPGMEPKPDTGPTQLAALPPPSAPAPKPADLRPFSGARGTMPFPAVGTLKSRYGEGGEEPGALNKGIVIAARASGQVIAPFDGVVAFAGPFRGYGLLLIIEHSEGYHTLLAGLGRIDCVLEQRVFAGEPVGMMNNEGTADLYVELRQNGQPINPLPWLASRTAGKSNG
jgi:murein hydrolase activator